MSTNFEQQLAIAEANELHEFLDMKGIPRTKVSKDGTLLNNNEPYYILPLVDRVLLFAGHHISR
jgi:hypothetical protein